MANRTAKFALAIFASVLASTPITIVGSSAARAADNCLTEPKNETPQGQHWHYHIERGTKRHCWYLRGEGETLAQAASSNDAAADAQGDQTQTDQTQTNQPATDQRPVQRSIADAHDELPAPRARAGQAARNPIAQPAPINMPRQANLQTAANPQSAAGPQSSAVPAAQAPAPVTQQSPVSTRWPDPSGVISPANPPPEQAKTVVADADPVPQTEPSPAPAPLASAAAAAPTQLGTGSLPMLLLVILGALALAGLTGSLVYRLGRFRQAAHTAARRRDIWHTADHTPPPPWVDAQAEHFARQEDFSHTDDEAAGAEDAVERIEEFLARLSKLAHSDVESPSPR